MVSSSAAFRIGTRAGFSADRLDPADLIRGSIERYEIEHLHGLNFVMREALEGGVNTSLNLDSHGKSWSYLILALPIEPQ
jgi:hypothetical protein